MTEHDLTGALDPPPVDDGGDDTGHDEPWARRDNGPDTEELKLADIFDQDDDLDFGP